jgi:hypothetical protein
MQLKNDTLSVALSGAPFRVHVVDALSLVIAFTIPADNISKFEDIRQKWPKLFIYWLPGTLSWYFLTALVIVKWEINIEGLITLLAISFIGIFFFLALHLLFLRMTTDKQTNEPS